MRREPAGGGDKRADGNSFGRYRSEQPTVQDHS